MSPVGIRYSLIDLRENGDGKWGERKQDFEVFTEFGEKGGFIQNVNFVPIHFSTLFNEDHRLLVMLPTHLGQEMEFPGRWGLNVVCWIFRTQNLVTMVLWLTRQAVI